MGDEYANHYAPDEIEVYPVQGSMQSANNLLTALGQVRFNPYNTVGPRERRVQSPYVNFILIIKLYGTFLGLLRHA